MVGAPAALAGLQTVAKNSTGKPRGVKAPPHRAKVAAQPGHGRAPRAGARHHGMPPAYGARSAPGICVPTGLRRTEPSSAAPASPGRRALCFARLVAPRRPAPGWPRLTLSARRLVCPGRRARCSYPPRSARVGFAAAARAKWAVRPRTTPPGHRKASLSEIK